jgi:hypothetical protein
MTSKLSFTIFGEKQVVEAQAKSFMEAMSKIMGKEIKGTILVKLDREDGPEQTMEQVKKKQVAEMFGNKPLTGTAPAIKAV